MTREGCRETEVANPAPDFSPSRMEENKFSSRFIPSAFAPIPQQQATGRWHIPSQGRAGSEGAASGSVRAGQAQLISSSL